MGVEDCGFVDGEDGAFEGGRLGRICRDVGGCVAGGAIGLFYAICGGQRCWRRLNIDAPTAADAFDVESLTENADLAPRVPIGRNEDFVPVDDVVSESLLFEEGMDAET